ncbi:hypothetical protein MTBPR1_120097 [Candidatus Terasakiella magnetica]|uniref:Tyr recombinase domain-containing protein n=1 Tax=Candidatus Terasakiella magnetica TaxID=1867952 RepID=A0A1C3REV5_9PROT|nr:tyrosine-type recombinase/integrase [Candidatus Terasakiella magnetica]SCA55791.1 hypothetical protein MTBPR1_120097 [Candidatus Terasakiella magnetica]
MGTPFARKVLTDRMCVRTKPAKKDVLLWDANVPGLLLKISTSDYRSWSIQYVSPVTNTTRRYTFAQYGQLDVDAARETAQTYQARIRLEQYDPLEERRRGRDMVTLHDLLWEYHDKKLRFSRNPDAQSDFSYTIGKWFGDESPLPEKHRIDRMQLNALRKSDFTKMWRWVSYQCDENDQPIDEDGTLLKKGTPLLKRFPSAADKLVRFASAAWTWAIDGEEMDIPGKPFISYDYHPQEQQETHLSIPEYKKLWDELERELKWGRCGPSTCYVIMFIMLTGQRKREAMRAEKNDIRWDLGFIMSREKGRDNKPKKIFITPTLEWLLKRILNEKNVQRSQYLFPQTRNHLQPIADMNTQLKNLAKRAGIYDADDFSPHDLRRSWATMAADEVDYKDENISKALGHTMVTTTKRHYIVRKDKKKFKTAFFIMESIARWCGVNQLPDDANLHVVK